MAVNYLFLRYISLAAIALVLRITAAKASYGKISVT